MDSSVATLETQSRPLVGTGSSRQLRREGFIPGILYGAKKEAVAFSICTRHLLKEIQKTNYHTHLFEMILEGEKHKVLVKHIQVHPVTDIPLHVDLLRVDASSRLHVQVPLIFMNEEKSPGIKKGGVLNIVHHEILLTCDANAIPESLVIDLTGYEIGQTIHLDMIHLPHGTSCALAPESTIATLVSPSSLKSEESSSSGEDNASSGNDQK